jgi:hypothetical protein
LSLFGLKRKKLDPLVLDLTGNGINLDFACDLKKVGALT